MLSISSSTGNGPCALLLHGQRVDLVSPVVVKGIGHSAKYLVVSCSTVFFVLVVAEPSNFSISLRSSSESRIPPLGSQYSSRSLKVSLSCLLVSPSTSLSALGLGRLASISTCSLPFDASIRGSVNGCWAAILRTSFALRRKTGTAYPS